MYHEIRCPDRRSHTMGVSDFLGCSWMTRVDQVLRSTSSRRLQITETCSIRFEVFFARALHPTDTCIRWCSHLKFVPGRVLSRYSSRSSGHVSHVRSEHTFGGGRARRACGDEAGSSVPTSVLRADMQHVSAASGSPRAPLARPSARLLWFAVYSSHASDLNSKS